MVIIYFIYLLERKSVLFTEMYSYVGWNDDNDDNNKFDDLARTMNVWNQTCFRTIYQQNLFKLKIFIPLIKHLW